MNKLNFKALDKYLTKTKDTAHEFQNRALAMIEYMKPPKEKRSQLFRIVQENREQAESVFRYMKQRKITSVFYFFKAIGNAKRNRGRDNL